MIIKPIGSVELPRKPRRGMDALAFSESVYRSIQQLRDRVFVVHNPTKTPQKPNPFEVTLFKDSGTWKVTVADGYVNERIPGGTGDALIAHFPENIKDGEDRAKFTVVDGQQVSLIVEVDENGEINPEGAEDAVRVAIETIDETSTHFEPKIGDASTGVAGVYHYKLATIEEGDIEGVLELKPYLAGSHISHFRELPKLINLPAASTANTGRLVKEYDKASNQYRFRSIAKGDGQLRIDESGDNVTVRGNGKAATIRYQVTGSSATDVASFVDGLCDTTGTVTIPIPAAMPTDGWWGTLLWEHFVNIGDTSPYVALKLEVENGRIIGVEQQLPGGSLTAVTGTEGTPGSAAIASFATP